MANRYPIEYDSLQPTLSPGSVVPDPFNPGYYLVNAVVMGGTDVSATPNTVPIRDANGGFENAYLQIDTTPTVPQTGSPGKLVWNDTFGTLEFQLKGGVVNLQLGQEQVLRVRNQEVTPLVDGEVVYLDGSSGIHLNAHRADKSAATADLTIGVVTEPIGAFPGEGYVTTGGMVTCDTNHLTEGALVYLGAAGATTDTAPTHPDHVVIVGYCVKKAGAGTGRIFVAIHAFPELHELHDVLLTAPALGDLLRYDGAKWVNYPDSNYIPKSAFTAANQYLYSTAASTYTQGTILSGWRDWLATTKVAWSEVGSGLTFAAGSQLFLNGTGNLRLGIGFPSGGFSNANAVLEVKPHASTRFTFLDNLIGGAHNPALAVCCLNAVTGCGMALYADTTSSAFIFSDNGNFDITSDTKAHIEGGVFGGGTLRFRVSNTGIATAVGGMNVGDLTATRVPFAGASGRLTDSSSFTWVAPVLTAPKFNATDSVILPKTSGKGILVDNASPTFPWRDLLGAMHARQPAGATVPVWTTIRTGVYAWQWANTGVEQMLFVEFHVPHDLVPNSDMFLHAHWAQDTVDSGGPAGVPGTVEWRFDVSYADGHGTPGGAADPISAIKTVSVTQQACTTQYGHMIAEGPLTTNGGSATTFDSNTIVPDGVFLVRVYRDSSWAGDTLNQVPYLIGFVDIHFQSTGVGTKNRAPNFWG